jgi:tetraacyldisaccharide 4'-kinase
MTRLILTPLEVLYVWAVKRKLSRGRPARAPVPVVCVGNLTVGGVGKTPIVAMIRDMLTAKGLRAATLSRGYGGSERGPLKVDPAHHTAADIGDEPLMLSSRGESWIGRDRPIAAAAMAADGVDVIVMDDGHQNPSLAKTLSLVALDGAAPFGNGFCLPKGPLREPVETGLARADALLLVGDGDIPTAVLAAGKPVWRVHLEPRGTVPDGPLIAFAGIGRPAKFFDSLTETGANLKDGVGFADHYVYTRSDMDFLSRLAADHSARLITTEKDYARLPTDWRSDILTWPIQAAIRDKHVAFTSIVEAAVQRGDHDR